MVTKQKILIVDDDENIAELISLYLTKECFDTMIVHDGEEALTAFESYQPNLMLLDLMLPGIDGYQVCREIRSKHNTPIIMLSAKGEVFDKVLGLELGADDYLIKPFAFEELLARIRVMMRRKPQFTSNQLKIADLILDRDTRKVTRAGNEIDLSAKEFMVLECLMRNKNIVMTRQQIEQNAWDFDFEGGSNVIDVYIRYLRKKIDAQYEQKLIHTVRGVGYVMRENE